VALICDENELQRSRLPLTEKVQAMTIRHRFKQTQSLEDRLVEQAKSLLEQAQMLRPGPVRDELIRKARQAEAASHMNDWLTSPLQAQK
jgi:hypothetical protein